MSDSASARPPADLVFETIQRIQEIGWDGLEEMCQAHPDEADHLRRRLGLLRRAGLLGQLGSGGMGVVYLAVQESLEREVALKLIRPEQLYFESLRERFQREAGVLAELKHPGVVRVLSYGEESGIPYFAMELLEGRTLGERLETLPGRAAGALSGSDWSRSEAVPSHDSAPTAVDLHRTWHEGALRLIAQAARALHYVHERGVLHRDIKPSNIMVLDDGHPVLFDFGLAASERSDKLTRTGSVMGSLFYMSPEQIRGEPLDARSDVYALGVSLYETLTLRCPYRSEDALTTRQLVLGGQPRPLRALNPALPRDVETVCLKAMDVEEKNVQLEAALEDRGASLETIEDALQWLVNGSLKNVPGMEAAQEQLLIKAGENRSHSWSGWPRSSARCMSGVPRMTTSRFGSPRRGRFSAGP